MITQFHGDWITCLIGVPDKSVQCCITSPPYWGLRNYGVPGQIGLEETPELWTVAPANFKDAHFATFPPKLIEPCVLAGSRPGDTILDPFAGSGTVGQVATEYGRDALLIDLNPDYHKMIEKRTRYTVRKMHTPFLI